MELIIMVRCSDESWLEPILDDEGEPTGRFEREYGPFCAIAEAIPIKGSHAYKINPGKGPVYIKGGVEYFCHAIDASRIDTPDYDAWAQGALGALGAAGIVYEADTVSDPQQWIIDNGFVLMGEPN